MGPANRPAFCRQVPLFYVKCPSINILQVGRSAFINFAFVASLIPLSFHIVINPPIAALSIAILLRIALSHNPSLVINAPRNMKLVTTYTIFPPSVTSPIYPVVMTFVFRTFRYRPAFSVLSGPIPYNLHDF